MCMYAKMRKLHIYLHVTLRTRNYKTEEICEENLLTNNYLKDVKRLRWLLMRMYVHIEK